MLRYMIDRARLV